MIPITASVSNTGFAHTAAAGNKYKPNRRNPYVPIFSNTPAKMTEPPVGACVCASGNQVCSGKIGTFTANAMAKGSEMAARGDFRGGQAIMKTYKQKMKQNINS